MEDPKIIKEANDCRVDILKKQLSRYDDDSKQERRLELQLCKCCMYLDNTELDVVIEEEYTCLTCLETFGVTIGQLPKICPTCAKKDNVCTMCGSEMD